METDGGGRITSRANPALKRIRKLQSRKHREAEGVFLVEGIRPVRAAIDQGAELESLVVAPDLLTSPDARRVVEERRSYGTAVLELSADAFSSIAEREHPSGLAAVVKMPDTGIEDLRVGATSLFACVHDAGNPGNVGTIVRTVDAMGGDGVVLTGTSTDPFHPSAVKASMGSIFAVPVCRAGDFEIVTEWCDRHEVSLLPTSARAAVDLREADVSFPAMVVFGSEAEGLPAHILEQGSAVRIPMFGSATSLNLAVAAGIVLYELARRREPGKLGP